MVASSTIPCERDELSPAGRVKTLHSWMQSLTSMIVQAETFGFERLSEKLLRGEIAMETMQARREAAEVGAIKPVVIYDRDPFDHCDDSSSDIHQVEPPYEDIFAEIGRATGGAV